MRVHLYIVWDGRFLHHDDAVVVLRPTDLHVMDLISTPMGPNLLGQQEGNSRNTRCLPIAIFLSTLADGGGHKTIPSATASVCFDVLASPESSLFLCVLPDQKLFSLLRLQSGSAACQRFRRRPVGRGDVRTAAAPLSVTPSSYHRHRITISSS